MDVWTVVMFDGNKLGWTRDHFCPFPRKDVWQEPSCLAIWSCGRMQPEMKYTGVTSNLFLTSFCLAVWPFSFLLHQPQQIHLHTVYKYLTTRTSSWNVHLEFRKHVNQHGSWDTLTVEMGDVADHHYYWQVKIMSHVKVLKMTGSP